MVKEVNLDAKKVTIRHEEITNYMPAMTMPFKVKDGREIASLHAGDTVTFRLLVTADESWIDLITKTGTAPVEPPKPAAPTQTVADSAPDPTPFTFTNEFGQAVNLKDFTGQAVGLTFFFTRCPVPDYCPRLSKSFSEACKKLSAQPNAPTNWHFLSVSFDSQFDSPEILKAYAQRYQYDSNHWSFLTGPPQRVGRLAKMFGMSYEPDGLYFKHEFRTIVIDANGRVQQIYPFVGDFSDSLVEQMVQAAKVKRNR